MASTGLEKKTIFFSGLNEIRALAAIGVIIQHLELHKFISGNSTLYSIPYLDKIIHRLGLNGVLLFFVLSGFLITYLLLEEREKTGDVSIRKFYFRRILRIWPLYYLSIFIGFALFPLLLYLFPGFFEGQTYFIGLTKNIIYGENLLLFLVFMSNLAFGTYPAVAGASQSWSVSVEEQFYLIWPWIINLGRKHLALILIFLIIGINVFSFYFSGSLIAKSYPIFRSFLYTVQIDFMAAGGLLALWYFKSPNQLKRLVKNPIFVALILLIFGYHFGFEGIRIVKAFCYAFVILIFIEWKITFRPLNFLGKISYGLYMYHGLVLYLIFPLFNYSHLPKEFLNPFVYVGAFGGTILISLLSYKFIEMPLLKRKEAFAVVKSGKTEI